MEEKNQITKYDYLDQLRGIAILGVILTHLHYLNLSTWNNSIFDTICKIWWMGVPLFFIISAYTLSLSSSTRKAKEKHHRYKFFIRRLFRIYPLFFVIINLVFIGFSSLSEEFLIVPFDSNLKNLLTHLSFTFGIFPKYISSMYVWERSLFNEVIFYCCFPFLYYLFSKIKISKAIFITMIAGIISYIGNIITHTYGIFDIYGTPITHMFSFFIGILVFKVNHFPWNEKLENFFKKNTKYFIFLNILMYCILTICYIKFGYLHVYIPFIINLALTLLLFIKKLYNIPTYLGMNRFLKFTGIISYSLYLLNYPLYILMGSVYVKYFFKRYSENITEYNYIIFVIIILYIIAYITYKYIEQPWIKKWKKIIAKYF